MSNLTEFVIKGEEFVIISKAEYLRMKGSNGDNAIEYAVNSIAKGLKAAREAAGITQAELAKRLKRSQALVSSAESGSKEVGARYVKAVLKACGLPEDWKPR